MQAVVEYTGSQLTTIKQTVAKDTNDIEFNLFMGACKSYGLDPFRKQISAIVFNKDKPAKRNMTIIVGRDGLRSVAQRCGDYRPASSQPGYVYDESLKGDLNPIGLVSVSVNLFKQDNKGEWYPVFGEAYWDEYAPIKDKWAENEQGKYRPTGEKTLDTTGQWGKMSRVMLVKCAEAQALRAGWPDVFSGLYAEEELDQAVSREMTDVTPSEQVENEAAANRQNRLGNKSILMTLDDTGVFERVPVGEMADKCAEFISNNDAEQVHVWAIQNREPLKEFWAINPNDALAVKKLIEDKTLNVGRAA